MGKSEIIIIDDSRIQQEIVPSNRKMYNFDDLTQKKSTNQNNNYPSTEKLTDEIDRIYSMYNKSTSLPISIIDKSVSLGPGGDKIEPVIKLLLPSTLPCPGPIDPPNIGYTGGKILTYNSVHMKNFVINARATLIPCEQKNIHIDSYLEKEIENISVNSLGWSKREDHDLWIQFPKKITIEFTKRLPKNECFILNIELEIIGRCGSCCEETRTNDPFRNQMLTSRRAVWGFNLHKEINTNEFPISIAMHDLFYDDSLRCVFCDPGQRDTTPQSVRLGDIGMIG